MNYDNSHMAEPACETYYTELKGWMPPFDAMRMIGMSAKEIYWRYALARMAQKAVFDGFAIFSGKDGVQDFFQKIADACACLGDLPDRNDCMDGTGSPIFTNSEYNKLKGICSRNSPERYAAMRDAIQRLEESRKALLEKARLAAAAAETEDETEDEIPE